MLTSDVWGRWLRWGSGLSIGDHWEVVGTADVLWFKARTHSSAPPPLLLSRNGGSALLAILIIQGKLEKLILYKMSYFFVSWHTIPFMKSKVKPKNHRTGPTKRTQKLASALGRRFETQHERARWILGIRRTDLALRSPALLWGRRAFQQIIAIECTCSKLQVFVQK